MNAVIETMSTAGTASTGVTGGIDLAPDPVGQEVDTDELLIGNELHETVTNPQPASSISLVAKTTSLLTDQPFRVSAGNSTVGRFFGAIYTWQYILLVVVIAAAAWWYFKKK